jgi:hypothetical protein
MKKDEANKFIEFITGTKAWMMIEQKKAAYEMAKEKRMAGTHHFHTPHSI